MYARRAAVGLALLAILAFGTPSPRVARGDEPKAPAAAPIDPAWVTIAEVEHARGDVARLVPFLAPGADAVTRRRAIVALGRIGSDRAAAAPLLREMIERGGAELPLALWAAGISGEKALVPKVLRALDAAGKDATDTIAAALEALGQLGEARADGYVLPFLEQGEAKVRAAAALALMRLGAERDLEALAARAGAAESNPEVKKPIAAGIWRLAGARKKAKSTKDKPWEGSATLAGLLWDLTKDRDPETRLFALRADNALLPKVVVPPAAGADPDPRVVADVVFRFAANHEGPFLYELVGAAATNPDALVRQMVAEACATLATPEAKAVLDGMLPKEGDPRVRDSIAIAFAACGDDAKAREIFARDDRPNDKTARLVAEAQALLASKAKESLAASIAIARDPKTPVLVLEALLEGFAKKEHPDLLPAARELLKHPDPIVRSGAAELAGKKAFVALVPDLIAAYRASPGRAGQDPRNSIVGALGKLAAPPEKGEARSSEADAATRDAIALVREALSDPAPTVRLAAREAAADLPALKDLPDAKEEKGARNEWHGLPRPKGPILGVDLSGGAGPLSEAEILLLARAITDQKAGVVMAVEGLGEIRLALDAESAPVHAVNLVLSAAAGIYDGTTWHRVVPAFVIQGADPRGDGSGDAGYAVPDEITRTEFRRGVLGMPKNTKDTGGCQVFLMHCWAPHLDGRYTAFGHAVSGLEVIDRVRVGDRITKATVEAPLRPPLEEK